MSKHSLIRMNNAEEGTARRAPTKKGDIMGSVIRSASSVILNEVKDLSEFLRVNSAKDLPRFLPERFFGCASE
jgi:hypothetical protein